MKEMKTLNDYEIVDKKAREDILAERARIDNIIKLSGGKNA